MIIFIFVKISIALNPLATKIKICLVTVTLSDGGAERVAAELSKYFVAQGYEVHHVVFSGKIVYEHAGNVLHLETLKDATNSLWSRYKRFTVLASYLKKQKFNFIIDFRTKEFYWQEFILHRFVYKNYIQTIHSYHLSSYFPSSKIATKLLYPKQTRFITVSHEIEKLLRQDYTIDKVTTIYNPLDVENIFLKSQEPIENKGLFILAVGSMHGNIKQFDVLIKAYAASVLPKNNIKLCLLGEGKLKTTFQELVQELGLTDKISFEGHITNPFAYYAKALFTVSTSKYEGLPMSILESLACGTPVISYDYLSGPSEIIHNFENGLLVKNQDTQALVQALNTLFEDKTLYLHCKSNAKLSVRKFDTTEIGKQWEHLFRKS